MVGFVRQFGDKRATMWFDLGRDEGFPTQYAPNKTPVTVDVLEAGLILSFVILAVCFYIILIGARGKSLINLGVRVTVSLTLGAIIIVGNFGQEWEVGHIKTPTAYKIGTGQEILADISVKIGFRSVNVTLKADSPKDTVLEHEKIDYNERFDWTWDQGRFGFGPYAGHLQQSFRAAQYKGLPLPILWVVDYFVFDGEGLRFGRFYRTAGWYAHIIMWIAFACWILTNILFRSVIRYGVNFLAVTGLLQLFACFIWGVVKNPQDLSITFEKGELQLNYGSSFYVTLIGGIICSMISILIFVFNIYKPDETAEFFGIDPLSDYDEYHLSPSELDVVRQKTGQTDQIQMTEMGHPEQPPSQEKQRDIVLLKRRSTVRFGKKNLYRNVNYEEDIPIYSNLESIMETDSVPLHPSTSGQRRAPVLPPKRMR